MSRVGGIESSTATSQEIVEHWQYQVAYYPLPRGLIKQEPPMDQEECKEQTPQLKAYSPLPRAVIKEESEYGDSHDESITQVQVTS